MSVRGKTSNPKNRKFFTENTRDYTYTILNVVQQVAPSLLFCECEQRSRIVSGEGGVVLYKISRTYIHTVRDNDYTRWHTCVENIQKKFVVVRHKIRSKARRSQLYAHKSSFRYTYTHRIISQLSRWIRVNYFTTFDDDGDGILLDEVRYIRKDKKMYTLLSACQRSRILSASRSSVIFYFKVALASFTAV